MDTKHSKREENCLCRNQNNVDVVREIVRKEQEATVNRVLKQKSFAIYETILFEIYK